jgi:exodeoxyribonuclease VII large subunit
LNAEARRLLESGFPPIWLEGELSNLARPASGHLYFSLKDAQCQVRCAMFRNRNLSIRFAPQNGLHVLIRAQVSLYEGRGEFQLIVEQMEPAGDGALKLALEQLKAKLQAEGLFAAEAKRPLPALPQRVGVVTSPSGAAIRDIVSVLRRRFPALEVVIYPVPVQGAGAGARIAEAIALAGARRECDVLILARGGGSLEDLWAFNEEIVARAIYACELPVVSGIGHEVDFTIADLVADRRAATPSAAAELVSPDLTELSARITNLAQRLVAHMQRRLAHTRDRLTWLDRRLVHPGRRLQELTQRLDELALRLPRSIEQALRDGRARLAHALARLQQHSPVQCMALGAARCEHLTQRLIQAMQRQLDGQRSRLTTLRRALHAISPLATLERGYAIVSLLPDGMLLREAERVQPGARVRAKLARGELYCRVEDIHHASRDSSD